MTSHRVLALFVGLLLNASHAFAGVCNPVPGAANDWIDQSMRQELDAAMSNLERYGLDVPRDLITVDEACGSEGVGACYIHTKDVSYGDSSVTVTSRQFRPTGYSEPVLTWNPYCRSWVQVGCRPQMAWQNIETERPVRVKRVEESDAIYMQRCVQRRGWMDLDPTGVILWDTDFKSRSRRDMANLYYRYAKRFEEALEFLLAHEIAHYAGIQNDREVDEYASHVVLEIRRMKRDWPYKTYAINSRYSGSKRTVACHLTGSPPPLDNWPTGSDDVPGIVIPE
ncbi:MAG: hypothetical protein HYV34_04985 [Candidatus Kerfeldbacteria bacterium]|nr:hypothetical protein [Candidatus Kerfeldbacteria bacterium]